MQQEVNEFFDSPAPFVVDKIKEQVMQLVSEALTAEGELNGVSFTSLNDNLKAITIDQIFYILKEGIKKDMGLPTDGSDKPDEEEEETPTREIPGFEGTTDALDKLSIREDGELNESIEKIRSEFKRFL